MTRPANHCWTAIKSVKQLQNRDRFDSFSGADRVDAVSREVDAESGHHPHHGVSAVACETDPNRT